MQVSADHNRRFESLFRNVGTVDNGFPELAAWEHVANPDDYKPETIRDSLMFGTPDQVIVRLKDYEAAGVDNFCYGASFGLPHEIAMRSLELFIGAVMPHFAENKSEPQPVSGVDSQGA